MPRPKYGLGQGLEALVSSRQRPSGWPGEESPGVHPEAPTPASAEPKAWVYAALTKSPRRKKGKRTLTLQFSNPELHVRPRRQQIRGMSLWTALGMLGADGWELVGFRRRTFVLKRACGA